MIDCGLTLESIEERFRRVERRPSALAGVLITHEHGDHAHGLAAFTRRYKIPVWATPGTASAIVGLRQRQSLSCHRPFAIGELAIEPFPVPHDAREPCHFAFSAAGRRLGVVTDTGHVTPTIAARLAACDALALECNHDLEMLANGPYPPALKERVGSRYGHLNNAQSAELVAGIQHAGLQWIMALHLSERNNTPDRVRAALGGVAAGHSWRLELATQGEPTPWLEIE